MRHCHGLAEFAACLEVERAVWRSSDIDLVPLPLFVVAAEIGGQVLGAFDGDRIVGFTLAFPGVRERRPFLHSHMTGVLAAYWNRGIARSLKLFQRRDALSRNIDRIEWTFDPLQVKNAYFNLVRLGAIVRRYLPNVYGATTSPLHSGLPTDRLVAEWWLRSARVRQAVSSGSPAQRHRRGRRGAGNGFAFVFRRGWTNWRATSPTRPRACRPRFVRNLSTGSAAAMRQPLLNLTPTGARTCCEPGPKARNEAQENEAQIMKPRLRTHAEAA